MKFVMGCTQLKNTWGMLMRDDYRKHLTRETVMSRLHYNPSTGVFTWVDGWLAGKRAGSVRQHGYRVISIGRFHGRVYEHRLAVFYMTGEWPNAVDHINHERADNRWCNLRPASTKINSRNQKLRKTNTSGYTGVSRTKVGDWRAYVVFDGKQKFLGVHKTRKSAAKAVRAAHSKLGFHQNHGLAFDLPRHEHTRGELR